MRYLLELFRPDTWHLFRANGSSVVGFQKSFERRAQSVGLGDVFVCYLGGVSRWCGALRIESRPYLDAAPIFSRNSDKYQIRFRVKPIVALDPEFAVPVCELWNILSRTRDIPPGTNGWIYSAGLGSSLNELDETDGRAIVERLNRQKLELQKFPLSYRQGLLVVRATKGL
jgi:hypothetical protein